MYVPSISVANATAGDGPFPGGGGATPFVLGGVLKMVYDVLLYVTFKDVEPKNLD